MKSLSPVQALLCALFNAETRTYPSYEGRRLEPADIAGNIRKQIEATNPQLVIDDDLLAKAKESLEEAKGQTEYQDQKVARLLTIVAFLTAAAGTLFSKVADSFPIDHSIPWVHWHIMVYAAYLLFFGFVFLVGAGALVSFHAMRTRFVWEAAHSNMVVERDRKPKSHLFFQEVVRTTPEKWAESFSATKNAQLTEAYKGYIVEAYLVNAKVADKLRLLEPAQAILSNAVRVLLIWLFIVAVLFITVDRPVKRDLIAAANGLSQDKANVSPTVDPMQSARTADANTSNVNQSIVVSCGAEQTRVRPSPPAPKPPTAHKCDSSVSGVGNRLESSDRQ